MQPHKPTDSLARKLKIAFICVHNSCRSQIAEALCRHFEGNRLECYSAGTKMKAKINPDAVRLVKQFYDINMELTQRPKLLADIPPVDVIVTMGCNVACPFLPCQHREDWGLDDPTGKDDETLIQVIHHIEAKIKEIAAKEWFVGNANSTDEA